MRREIGTIEQAGLVAAVEQAADGVVITNSDGRGFTYPFGRPHQELRDVTAISTIVHDISERRDAEQTRALLASIVESSNDAIHGVSLDGTIVREPVGNCFRMDFLAGCQVMTQPEFVD
jgi:hypothetical protein